MTILTKKQNTVLMALKEYYVKFKRMPSLRELMEFLARKYKLAVGNVRGVVQYLEALERKGLIKRGRGPREIELLGWRKAMFWRIPIIGWVSAGEATAFAQDSVTGYLTVSKELLGRIGGRVIGVEVTGDSMNQKKIKGKNIEDGDFVMVDTQDKNFQNSDIVVANIDGLLTVKEFQKPDKDTLILLPNSTNPEHKPIYLTLQDEAFILGKVVDVYKKS